MAKKKERINDRERKLWVENTTDLYVEWKGSGLTIGAFVKKHRALIDRTINERREREER